MQRRSPPPSAAAAHSGMARYLPKKKYLQLLHDPTPPGSNAPPSCASSEEPSSPDLGPETTPSPGRTPDEPEPLGFVANSASPGSNSVGPIRGHTDGLCTEEGSPGDDVGSDGRLRRIDDGRNYDTSPDEGVMFCGVEAIFLPQDTESAPPPLRLEKSNERYRHGDHATRLVDDSILRSFGVTTDRGINLVESAQQAGDSQTTAMFVDKSFCDSDVVAAATTASSAASRMNDCDLLNQELLDSSSGLLPGLASFAGLSDVDLLYGGLQASSASLSSFLNSCEAKASPSTPGEGSGREFHPRAMDWGGSGPSQRRSPARHDDFLLFDANASLRKIARPCGGAKRRYGDARNSQEAPGSSDDAEEDTATIAADLMVRIKEEAEDEEYENTSKRPLVTTSGRNRGCGKSLEPKYVCQVCGDTAAGFHCGAYVCEACKKFYLRCLKSGGTPAFLCPKNNDCVIEKDTRSHCQFCRFQKCVQLDMYKPGREDDKKLKIDFRTIPCKVCNAPSSGFHFGAITCEGCKGFFRRMLKEQMHKKFVCTNGDTCDIDSANRTTCKCCRFAKCLRIGMKLEGTRLGRQSNSVKRSTLMEYTGRAGGGASCSSSLAHSSSALASSLDRHTLPGGMEGEDRESGGGSRGGAGGSGLVDLDYSDSEDCVERDGLYAARSDGTAAHCGGLFEDRRCEYDQRAQYAARSTVGSPPDVSAQRYDAGISSRGGAVESQDTDTSHFCDVTRRMDVDNEERLSSGVKVTRCAEPDAGGYPPQRRLHALRVSTDDEGSYPPGNGVFAFRQADNGYMDARRGGVFYPGIGSFCQMKSEEIDPTGGQASELIGFDKDRWATNGWMEYDQRDVANGHVDAQRPLLLQMQSSLDLSGPSALGSPQTPHDMMSPMTDGRQANGDFARRMSGVVESAGPPASSRQLQQFSPLSSVHSEGGGSGGGATQEQLYNSGGGAFLRGGGNGALMEVGGEGRMLHRQGSVDDFSCYRGSLANPNPSAFGHHEGVGVMRNGSGGSAGSLALSPESDYAGGGGAVTRKCRFPSGTSQEALERDRLLYQDALGLFRFLTASFKELNDILIRPQELDDLQHDPATLDTLWKLVEIPFMHQAKVVLKFVKKIPGFRQLPVEDQIRMAQDSLYPITLIFHAQFYDEATGAYNWFINTPEERDLILSVLPPFAVLANHFRSVGQALKSLALTEAELAFLTTMTAFTAADGSYLQAAREVEELQEELLEAFVSYQTALGVAGNNRLAMLLARLPELKRANIEHRLVAAQVQQLAPQVEMSNLWQEVFLCSADGNR